MGCCASAARNATALKSLVGAGTHSIPRPVLSATGVPPGRHLPQMPPVDIALIGREHHFAPVRRERDIFHLERPRREQRRVAARRGNGIEVRPSIGLPGKYDAPAVGPQQLIARRHAAEYAPGTRCRAPDFAAGAGFHGGYADGPRLARTVGFARRAHAARRHAEECDATPVGRPFGFAVVIRAGVEVAQRIRRHVVDPDEAVIAARAGERDPRAVGRPHRARAFAARLEELRGGGLAIQRRNPELPVPHEHHAIALR